MNFLSFLKSRTSLHLYFVCVIFIGNCWLSVYLLKDTGIFSNVTGKGSRANAIPRLNETGGRNSTTPRRANFKSCVIVDFNHFERNSSQSGPVGPTQNGTLYSASSNQIPQLPVNTLAGPVADKQANAYLRELFARCDRDTWPRRTGDCKPRCPCIPHHLSGRLNVDEHKAVMLTWDSLNELARGLGVRAGGHWSPAACSSRQRLAIIIPCRDRESHLRALLNHLIPILVRQQVEFRIFVVEQSWPGAFNKGSMMNIGYKEALKLWDFDCVMFHDVDLLMQDDRNLYRCRTDRATHFGAYLDRYNFGIIYGALFGGVVAMSKEYLEKTNGYSNLFFGWGGEDDDFAQRVVSNQIQRYRPPRFVARYISLKHTRDEPFKQNVRKLRVNFFKMRKTPWVYSVDGINSVNYDVKRVHTYPAYTFIWVALDVSSIPTFAGEISYEYSPFNGSCRAHTDDRASVSKVTCQFMCDQRAVCKAYAYDGTLEQHCQLYTQRATCVQGAATSATQQAKTYMKGKLNFHNQNLMFSYKAIGANYCEDLKRHSSSVRRSILDCAISCDADILCNAFALYQNRCYHWQSFPNCDAQNLSESGSYARLNVFIKDLPSIVTSTGHLYKRAVGYCTQPSVITTMQITSDKCAKVCENIDKCIGFTYTEWLTYNKDTCILLSSCKHIKKHTTVWTFLKNQYVPET